jgi:hypothetical protein
MRPGEHIQDSLVSVTPAEVFGADVLVRVLGALFKRRKVRPMLPMLVPKVISVDSAQDERRDDGAEEQKHQPIILPVP